MFEIMRWHGRRAILSDKTQTHNLREVWKGTHIAFCHERKKGQRGTADRTIELPRNNKKGNAQNARGTRGKSQDGGCQMTVTTVYRIRSFKSRFFQLHCHSQNPPMYRSMSNKAISIRIERPRFERQLKLYRAKGAAHLFVVNYSSRILRTRYIRFSPKSRDYGKPSGTKVSCLCITREENTEK